MFSSFEVWLILMFRLIFIDPADHAFHFSHLHIILDRTGALLEAFASGLVDGSFSKTPFEYVLYWFFSNLNSLLCARYAPLCQFFAHLCLFLQMIDISVPPLATQTILEAYLEVLEVCLLL